MSRVADWDMETCYTATELLFDAASAPPCVAPESAAAAVTAEMTSPVSAEPNTAAEAAINAGNRRRSLRQAYSATHRFSRAGGTGKADGEVGSTHVFAGPTSPVGTPARPPRRPPPAGDLGSAPAPAPVPTVSVTPATVAEVKETQVSEQPAVGVAADVEHPAAEAMIADAPSPTAAEQPHAVAESSDSVPSEPPAAAAGDPLKLDSSGLLVCATKTRARQGERRRPSRQALRMAAGGGGSLTEFLDGGNIDEGVAEEEAHDLDRDDGEEAATGATKEHTEELPGSISDRPSGASTGAVEPAQQSLPSALPASSAVVAGASTPSSDAAAGEQPTDEGAAKRKSVSEATGQRTREAATLKSPDMGTPQPPVLSVTPVRVLPHVGHTDARPLEAASPVMPTAPATSAVGTAASAAGGEPSPPPPPVSVPAKKPFGLRAMGMPLPGLAVDLGSLLLKNRPSNTAATAAAPSAGSNVPVARPTHAGNVPPPIIGPKPKGPPPVVAPKPRPMSLSNKSTAAPATVGPAAAVPTPPARVAPAPSAAETTAASSDQRLSAEPRPTEPEEGTLAPQPPKRPSRPASYFGFVAGTADAQPSRRSMSGTPETATTVVPPPAEPAVTTEQPEAAMPPPAGAPDVAAVGSSGSAPSPPKEDAQPKVRSRRRHALLPARILTRQRRRRHCRSWSANRGRRRRERRAQGRLRSRRRRRSRASERAVAAYGAVEA